MIHVFVEKHKDSDNTTLVHFHSVAELNGYYRNGIPGSVIANRLDLAALKEKHKNDELVTIMLNRIDEKALDGVVCKIVEGKCQVTGQKPEDKATGKAA